MIVVLARESAMRRQTTPRKLAVWLARKIFIVRKASTKSGPQKQKGRNSHKLLFTAPL
jgi:hypothetical protein